MRQVQAIYNGSARVPLPEVERNEAASVPNLLAQGIDQMAGRIASVTPSVAFTPKNNSNRRDARRAITAGRVMYGYWQADRFEHEDEESCSPHDCLWDESGGDPVGFGEEHSDVAGSSPAGDVPER